MRKSAMKIVPTRPSNYPFFILLYWLIIWLLVSVIIYINLSSRSIEGSIPTKDCVREKDNICVLFSAPYKVPLQQELSIQIVGAGILIGAVVTTYGYGRMILAYKRH